MADQNANCTDCGTPKAPPVSYDKNQHQPFHAAFQQQQQNTQQPSKVTQSAKGGNVKNK